MMWIPRTFSVVMGIVAAPGLLVSWGQAIAQTKAKNACELVTSTEIAKALNVPQVKKDDINSGEHVMTHVDICNWFVKENSPEGIEVRWYRGKGGEGGVLAEFSAAKGHAVEHDSSRDARAQPVDGIGEEAIYGPYPIGNGGSIAVRTSTGAVSIVGSASKDGLVALAKLAASRM